MLIPSNHLSIHMESSIKEICKPLFESSGVTYFIFARFYDNGTHIALPSNAAWHVHFWQKNYQMNSQLRLFRGTYLWDADKEFLPACKEAKDSFNIDNKFDIIERGPDYFEIFGFAGSSGDKKIVNYYYNHICQLKKFSFYFKDRANKLIKQSEKLENRLFIEGWNKKLISPLEAIIKPHLNIRQFRLQNTVLSRREIESVLMTLRGRTANEARKILNISQKTFEFYIRSAKRKLQCSSRAELFDKSYAIGLIDLAKDLSLF